MIYIKEVHCLVELVWYRGCFHCLLILCRPLFLPFLSQKYLLSNVVISQLAYWLLAWASPRYCLGTHRSKRVEDSLSSRKNMKLLPL